MIRKQRWSLLTGLALICLAGPSAAGDGRGTGWNYKIISGAACQCYYASNAFFRPMVRCLVITQASSPRPPTTTSNPSGTQGKLQLENASRLARPSYYQLVLDAVIGPGRDLS
jgi:hypothetical protein